MEWILSRFLISYDMMEKRIKFQLDWGFSYD